MSDGKDFVSETLQWGAMFIQHISYWVLLPSWVWFHPSLGCLLYQQIPDSTSSRYYEGLLSTYNKGVLFQETQSISGQCVAESEETGIPMNELSFRQPKAIDSRFQEDIAEALAYETSAERRSAKSGTSMSLALEQIQVIKPALSGTRV
ncbi:hypothetical protein V8C34DRAFT_304340 [Trichoderma compactum]